MELLDIKKIYKYVNADADTYNKITEICKLTKTGKNKKPYSEIVTYPMLLYCLCSIVKCENFFEIGTAN